LTGKPQAILSGGWHRLWFATHFLGTEDKFTVNFRGFAISREKQVMGDLLQYAKELTHEQKIKRDEEGTETTLNTNRQCCFHYSPTQRQCNSSQCYYAA
jgi:hypothetical protein